MKIIKKKEKKTNMRAFYTLNDVRGKWVQISINFQGHTVEEENALKKLKKKKKIISGQISH